MIGPEGDPPFSRLFVLSQNQVPQLRTSSRVDPKPTPRPIARLFGFEDLFELAVGKPFAFVVVVALEGLVVEDGVDLALEVCIGTRPVDIIEGVADAR